MKSFSMLMTSLMALPLSLMAIGCGPSADDIEAKIDGHALEIQTFSAMYIADTYLHTLTLESSEGPSCGPGEGESLVRANIFLTGDLADIPLEEPIVIDDTDQKSQINVDVKVRTGSCESAGGIARLVTGTVMFTELTETGIEGSIDLQVDEVESECAELASLTSISYKWSSFSTPTYLNEVCE
jgi:hypothetical protein